MVEAIKSKIRDIPDFPAPGVVFKDLTPLIGDHQALKLAIEMLIDPFREARITAVLGMEARGFIFGSLAAMELGVGFVPLRKPGKLPAATFEVSYELEYGKNELSMQKIQDLKDRNIVIIDDLLATGGTIKCAKDLIESQGARVVGCVFVVELLSLHGNKQIDCPVFSLKKYD